MTFRCSKPGVLLRVLRGSGAERGRMHDEDAASLVAPLFDRLTILFAAHAAPLAICAYVSARTGAAWPLAFLALDLVLLAARVGIVLFVRKRRAHGPAVFLRAARPYFAVGVLWALATGGFCGATYFALDDEASRALTATLAMGIVGGIASRNAATPRFALTLISALLLPVVVGGAVLGSWHWVHAALVSVYFAALCSIVRRHHADVHSAMRAQREKASLASRSEHMARHDALTGLPNRTLFHERLERAVEKLRDGVPFAVLYLDLDGFKEVNDGLGHAAGDRLLVAVAGRIQACVRPGDTVARLGGDEFAALLSSATDATAARAVAESLAREVGGECLLDGRPVSVGASIGVAFAPRDGGTSDLLLRHADMALYEAKRAGRGTHRVFDQAMADRLQARRDLEADLKQALVRGELELFYQPLRGIEGGIVCFEALLRWRHPGRGLVLPSDFIPVAEECGLIAPIGDWVLRAACAEAVLWPEPVRVAVNVSPAQLAGRDLCASVLAALRGSGLAAERLEVEITEAVALGDSRAAIAALRRVRALGVRVALDDFGTGYSSLAYLRTLPLDKIKIDRSFVRDLGGPDGALDILRAITTLGAALGLSTTAEGVETEAQLEQLRALGCTEAQGYLFGAPRPAGQVPLMLREASPLRRGFHTAVLHGSAVRPH